MTLACIVYDQGFSAACVQRLISRYVLQPSDEVRSLARSYVFAVGSVLRSFPKARTPHACHNAMTQLVSLDRSR